jgi:hypothetical protein
VKVLGIRFCSVSKDAAELAGFLHEGLGLPSSTDIGSADGFQGAVFPAGSSWVEVWPENPGMPAGIMLQIVVDDADAMAEQARANGVEPQGPIDAHGQRIYHVVSPTGLPITFQSRLPDKG